MVDGERVDQCCRRMHIADCFVCTRAAPARHSSIVQRDNRYMDAATCVCLLGVDALSKDRPTKGVHSPSSLRNFSLRQQICTCSTYAAYRTAYIYHKEKATR